jgi:hypothetical protein
MSLQFETMASRTASRAPQSTLRQEVWPEMLELVNVSKVVSGQTHIHPTNLTL